MEEDEHTNECEYTRIRRKNQKGIRIKINTRITGMVIENNPRRGMVLYKNDKLNQPDLFADLFE